jgi:hypothetical protein
MFRSCQIIIRELCCLLFLPFKYQLNCEYCNITLARNKAPWWWSDKIETFRSVLKCFKSILCEMTCAFVGWWIEVILQKNARCCTCFEQFLCPSAGVFFYSTHSNGICHTAGSGRNFRPNPARKLSANLYDIYHCCVYSEKLLVMDRGTVRNM